MYIQIKVIPKSNETAFQSKMDDDTFKIKLKAAPERGEANDELISFLAKTLNLRKSDIKIICGHTSQRKLLKVPDSTQIPW